MKKIIGKGTWIDKIASTIIKREIKIGRSTDLIRVESGIGASGIPHIGSLGDAVRAYGVSIAIQNMGYNSMLIAYSDDMDGLRKIPSGLPDWLGEYLAKPVFTIPDPFNGCHDSYGSHMSSMLLDGLDILNIKYKFINASQVYKKGILSSQIHKILDSGHELGHKISEIVGQEKFITSLPFFPVCESCGRLYVTKAQNYLSNEKKISYLCTGTKLGNREVKGCGYTGEVSIIDGKGKLAWKVEFAARWHAFDIRFEAYGKDIMDSVRVNDWVCDNVLEYPHPLHVKYEMFLDKGGKKISKSTGNVLTPQKWLHYGTVESIFLLLFKRIKGTRNIGIDDIPSLIDEYDLYEDLYFNRKNEKNEEKLTKIKGLYEYVNHLRPPALPEEHVPYRMMVQQASLFSGDDRIKKVYDRLVNYKIVSKESPALMRKIQLACNWADDYLVSDEAFEVLLVPNEKDAVSDLIMGLDKFAAERKPVADKQELQNLIYNIAKRNNIEPKRFFKLMYQMLINTDSGPKLGNYIIDLGIERIRNILTKYC